MNSQAFYLTSTHGVSILVLSVLAYEYFVVKKKEVAFHSIFSIIASAVLVVILKEMFLTTRPFQMNHDFARAGLTTFSSFPSGHTAISFALATTVTLHQKRLGVLVFSLASILSVSRVVANVHHPIDIAAGILIGMIAGIFFDNIHFKSKRRV